MVKEILIFNVSCPDRKRCKKITFGGKSVELGNIQVSIPKGILALNHPRK